MNEYDIIVVGGGHAGCEAALAAARMGRKTLLLTMSRDAIARMSCNPAIGGLAKGHLVREIDALGGEMGKIADRTGIQFRMLNRSKGPAVWGPRAQSDKLAYANAMQKVIQTQDELDICEDSAEELLIRDGKVYGLRCKSGEQLLCKVLILTTGTFLRAVMHTGFNTEEGGRVGEKAAAGLSHSLSDLGLELGRLKTGTPPRLARDSIDFSKTEMQHGDDEPFYFSYESNSWPMPQVPCYITYTNQDTHQVIRDNLHQSPLYSGKIKGIGPRYCPSIEDKVVRFADKLRHQIFLEPEGIDSREIYVNGSSTSLPADVQEKIMRTIPGLENMIMLRAGYAVEYDFVLTYQTSPSMQCKKIENLFLAGQINGTSGYEEAAAQGLMAGINACHKIDGKEPFILSRDEAYIGVLIDDLVTKCPREPYRMFTSRAEYRLLLRQDNADMRLTPYGFELGLISRERNERFQVKRDRIGEEIKRLKGSYKGGKSLAELLRQPEMHYNDVIPENDRYKEGSFQIEAEIKYEGYIGRQQEQVAKAKRLEDKKIPEWVDYNQIMSLKTEAKRRLTEVKPVSLGQASRIAGVTPADVSLLLVWIQKGNRQNVPRGTLHI